VHITHGGFQQTLFHFFVSELLNENIILAWRNTVGSSRVFATAIDN